MSIFDVGRVCVKIAGRDAGQKCVVVENVDSRFVVVDGAVRRKKVNIRHLEPLDLQVNLQGTSHEDVKKAFAELGYKVKETKAKKPAARPRHLKKKKEAPVEEKKKTIKKKAEKDEKVSEEIMAEESSKVLSEN